MRNTKFATVVVAFAAATALTLGACSSGEQEASKSAPAAEEQTQETKTEETATKSAPQTTTAQGDVITADAAKEAAAKHAGIDASAASFVKADLEVDDGKQIYDVKFIIDNVEYDYDIDAVTGDVLAYEQDTPDADDLAQAQNTTAQGNYIGEDAALTKALEHAGVAAGDATMQKVELDTDDGVTKYDVEFHVGATEYSYEIDAASGSVITFESEVDD